MKLFDSFKKLEMSKKLTVVILIFWILIVIADVFTYLILNNDINIIVDYVNTAFLVILGSYFGKSMIENISKIKVSDMFKSSNSNTQDIVSKDGEVGNG